MLKRTLFAAVIVACAVVSVQPADACDISDKPAATVFQSTSGAGAGHRPWIAVWNVKGAVKVTRVDPACAAKTICKGTSIEVARTAGYLRPRKELPSGARIQISAGTRLLEDVTITADPPGELPAWDGVEVISAKEEGEGLCSPKGPVVRLSLKPTITKLDGVVALFYLRRPDPRKPETGLAYLTSLGGQGTSLELHNGLGQPAWLKVVPKQLWMVLADGDGHVGPALQVI